ncbi:MAG: hypothetical protein Kow0031_20090 [Anaerolineae bacterium]
MQNNRYFDDILPEFWGMFKKRNNEPDSAPEAAPRPRTRTMSNLFQTVEPRQLEIYRAIDMAG